MTVGDNLANGTRRDAGKVWAYPPDWQHRQAAMLRSIAANPDRDRERIRRAQEAKRAKQAARAAQ